VVPLSIEPTVSASLPRYRSLLRAKPQCQLDFLIRLYGHVQCFLAVFYKLLKVTVTDQSVFVSCLPRAVYTCTGPTYRLQDDCSWQFACRDFVHVSLHVR